VFLRAFVVKKIHHKDTKGTKDSQRPGTMKRTRIIGTIIVFLLTSLFGCIVGLFFQDSPLLYFCAAVAALSCVALWWIRNIP